MTERLQLIKELPEQFTRKDALRLAIKKGYSHTWVSTELEKALIKERIKRIERGIYHKK